MRIADFLHPESVKICQGISTKKALLELLSEQLETCSGVESNKIFNKLVERERLGSTGLGQGVALPHIRMEGIQQVYSSFLALTPAVDFDSPDDKAVDLVFGLMVPEDANETHLNIIATIAQIFHDESYRTKLRQCHQEAQLYQCLIKTSCSDVIT